MRIAFYEQAELDPSGIPRILGDEKWRNRLMFRARPVPVFSLKAKMSAKRQDELLDALGDLADELLSLRLSGGAQY